MLNYGQPNRSEMLVALNVGLGIGVREGARA